VRSTEGGEGLLALLWATGGGEGKCGSRGGPGVECQLLQEIVSYLTEGREWLGSLQDRLQAFKLLVQPRRRFRTRVQSSMCEPRLGRLSNMVFIRL
jgi:hypothetical protein